MFGGKFSFSARSRRGQTRTNEGFAWLDPDVHRTKPIFISFPRFRRIGMRGVLLKMGRIPALPGDHRVVGSG